MQRFSSSLRRARISAAQTAILGGSNACITRPSVAPPQAASAATIVASSRSHSSLRLTRGAWATARKKAARHAAIGETLNGETTTLPHQEVSELSKEHHALTPVAELVSEIEALRTELSDLKTLASTNGRAPAELEADEDLQSVTARVLSLPSGLTLGFIGAGAMATAIAKGVGASGLLPWSALSLAHPTSPRTEAQEELAAKGATLTPSNAEVIARSSIVIMATKPDQVCPALSAERVAIAERGAQSPLFISIAAGLSLAAIEACLPAGSRVVRVMPNTPSLVGSSASAFALGTAAGPDDAAVVSALFDAIGRVVRVGEKDLNAVTGLSGSGPAYACLFVEALADGGVRAGLTRAVALELAIQTVLGSALLMQQTGQHPGQLKDQVASPGGTTIAGIHALERGGFRSTVMDAVVASATRAAEMGAAAAAIKKP